MLQVEYDDLTTIANACRTYVARTGLLKCVQFTRAAKVQGTPQQCMGCGQMGCSKGQEALTTQQRMPKRWYLFRLLCRKPTANSAAKSISAPLIIWYTDAVTDRRPMFMSTVATRSKKVGMASMKISFVLLPLMIAVSFVPLSCNNVERLYRRVMCAVCILQSSKRSACTSYDYDKHFPKHIS